MQHNLHILLKWSDKYLSIMPPTPTSTDFSELIFTMTTLDVPICESPSALNQWPSSVFQVLGAAAAMDTGFTAILKGNY